MSFHLYLLYHFLKGCIRLILQLYYPETVVFGRENLAAKGPTLVVSNHPNALMDPLNVVVRVNRPVFFLANASLFKPKWSGKILRTLYCIPIERQKDAKGRPTQNERNFQQCFDHLKDHGNIWIAPEGGSEAERRLRPIKTGTARIALSAAAQMTPDQEIYILPVGLTYFGQGRPCGSVVIKAGEPIVVSGTGPQGQPPSKAQVLELTEQLDKRLSALLIDTADEKEDNLLSVAEQLMQSIQPEPPAQNWVRAMRILSLWRRMAADKLKKQQSRLLEARGRLDQFGIHFPVLNSRIGLPVWVQALLIMLLSPWAVTGWLVHWPVCGIPGWLRRKYDIHPVYKDTVNTVAGLAIGLVYYPVLLWLVVHFGGWTLAVFFALTLPLVGRIAVTWPDAIRALIQQWRWKKIRKTKAARAIEKLQKDLAEELDEAYALR